jgi:hypothetical protein
MLVLGVGVLAGALIYAVSKRIRSPTKAATITVALIVCLMSILLCPYVFRKRTVPLMSDGRTIAFAKRPFLWGDNEYPIYAGSVRIFSLWGDMFDSPWFIYPFADGQRFLCVDDDDTSVLVFVVDCKGSSSNALGTSGWPPDEYTRTYLAGRAPKIVIGSKGSVRLPSYDEVREAADYVGRLSPAQLNRVSFPTLDLGFYRFYISKEVLLKELDANRNSVWP